MATTLSSTLATGCHAAGRNATSQCSKQNEDLVHRRDHGLVSSSFLHGGLRGCGIGGLGCGCGGFDGSRIGGSLGLGVGLGLLLGQPRIHFRGLGGMNAVIVLV